jgi:phosphatidylserine/phosphatidylglycerophosphate/cardiolipin synthase-like enzyme
LRTLAAGIYPFARRGEQTVRCGYERAIDNAQHYIYIEDQYVWPSSLVSGLRDAAARGVKIILVTSHEFTTPGPLRAAHNFMRQEVLQTLRSVHPENVLTFHLQRLDRGAEVYVHAKLMLVDDCYAVIGSANMNFRSQTSDSELSIAVVDDETRSSTMNGVPVQVCRFAAELRIALWAEHLGITDKQVLADPIEALELWPKPPANDNALPAQHHHAVWHDVPTPRRRGVGLLVNLMNPAASYPPTKSLV